MTDVAVKQERIQRYLAAQGLDALVMARHENFSWATGGGSSRIVATEEAGPVYLVHRNDGRRYAVTNVSEARRTAEEELDGQGYELLSCRWDEPAGPLLARALDGCGRVAADVSLPHTIPAGIGMQRLRYALTLKEEERYRRLCRISAEAVGQVCRAVQPGETEVAIGGRLAAALAPYGITPSVVLVATDERISKYRHPIATQKRLEKYLMLVLVAEQQGLHAALTRLVHFGPAPAEIQRRLEAVAQVTNAFHRATRPGVTASEVFRTGLVAYASQGFPDEWQLHHQGGAIGYAPREYVATAATAEVVVERQAFAWNPSITGAKCEDTILVTDHGADVLTTIDGWPLVAGQPGVLVR